jgi:hypothetical protein
MGTDIASGRRVNSKEVFVSLIKSSLFALLFLSTGACTAVSQTSPLTSRTSSRSPGPTEIRITTGVFKPEARVIGVFQITEVGYRWMHEVELRPEIEPRSILYRVAAYAREQGAQGVQQLYLLDTNPQTRGERVAKQVDTTVRLLDQLQRGRAPTALAEGTETRYEVQGELVRFN